MQLPLQPAGILPLTSSCHHYAAQAEVPPPLLKYWRQRHNLFDAYDDGVYMTDEAWFGVTPEPVATRIATDLAAFAPAATAVVDLFAGAGGSAIAFARAGRWARVVAVERDAATLACAQHNAQLYGVRDAITWLLADSFDLVPALDPRTTVLFASPPWGGPGYLAAPVFDLDAMLPYGLPALHAAYRAFDHALYLPRTSDLRQLAVSLPDGETITATQYCMFRFSKALVAYFPRRQSD